MMKIAFILTCIFISLFAQDAKKFEILKVEILKTPKHIEPSGIVKINENILIVSDEGSICNLSSSSCKVLKEKADFEGITASNKGEIFVVQEGKDNILLLNSNFKIVTTYNIPRKFNDKTVLEKKGDGLESLTFVKEDTDNYYFYTANQSENFKGKDRSALLFISLKKQTDEAQILDYFPMKIKDISGLHFSDEYSSLFLISDSEDKLFIYDSTLKLKTIYNLPGVDQEGIFIENDTLYIAQDSGDVLKIKIKPYLLGLK